MNCDSEQKLITTNKFLNFLLKQAKVIKKDEKLDLKKSLGRTLIADVVTNIDVPNFNNSAMDGYAINLNKKQKPPYSFKLTGRIAAGEIGKNLTNDCAVRIFTGAKIPHGANVVAIQERCEEINTKVEVFGLLKIGENIRHRGNDIKKGDTILKKGKTLSSADIGLCASVGLSKLDVFAKLKIGIFFSGNEIINTDENLQDGKIYNSNQQTINALLQELGCEIIDLGNIKDNFDATCQALTNLSKQCDVIITTGGVSVGEEDYIKPAIEKLGTIKIWKIKMKPGKPLVYGKIKNTHFIGLPGNPVSAMVTFILFAKPFLKKLEGQINYKNIVQKIQINFDWLSPQSRREFVRVRLDNLTTPPSANLYNNQSSNVLSSMSWADGLIEIPENEIFKKGAILNFYQI